MESFSSFDGPSEIPCKPIQRFDKDSTAWHFYTMKSYDVITWEEEGIWTSHAPSVPGAYGLGETPAESKHDLEEALGTLSEYLDEIGEALPRPRKIRTSQVRV
jgi:predicted RNase H-like HicB family nuclease